MDERIKKTWHTYTMGYYSATQNEEVLPFGTIWMKHEGITLSEISQVFKRQILYDLTDMWNLKNTELTDIENRLVFGRGGGGGEMGEGGQKV